MHMSPLRNFVVRMVRLRGARVLSASLLIGGTLTGCSAANPVEPTASSRAVAPAGPNRTGFQVGWGVSGGSDASTQTATKPDAVAKDSTKSK